MAFSTGQLAVTSTPAQVVTPDADGCRVILHCIGNAQVFLGGASVTTTTGLLIDKTTGPREIRLLPGDKLYAVTATTETLSYMILENA